MTKKRTGQNSRKTSTEWRRNARSTNHPDSSEAATQKVQKTVKIPQVSDRERGDAFDEVAERREDLSQLSSLKIAAMSFGEWKSFAATNEDLEQNITDIPVVMQRQVLVIQNAQRTVDVPLLQYIDTTVDVPVAKDAEKTPQKQHEDCITKYNEIQMDKKLHSAQLRTENNKSRLSSTMKVGATCVSEFDTRRGAALYVVWH